MRFWPAWKTGSPPGGGGGVIPAFTVTVEVPETPLVEAVIVVLPVVRAVTIPLPLTLATRGALELQPIVCPVRTVPAASFTTALSWVVWPVLSEMLAAVTATVAGGPGGG